MIFEEYKILYVRKISMFIIITILTVACSSFNYNYQIPPNQNDGITTSSINDTRLDSIKLESLVKAIDDEEFINVHSVLISKNNKLVFEEYFNGNSVKTKHNLRSAAKSFTSALVGIAIDKGMLKSSEERVLELFNFYSFINNWDKRKDTLKVKHLLTMSAGFDCGNIMDENSNCGSKAYNQKDFFKYLLDLPMANDPGKYFSYHDGLTLLVSGIIGITTNMSATDFKEKYLYSKLGIEKDPVTNGISSREMMKFGLLYLSNGIWNGERIISEEWIKESTKMHMKNPNKYIDGYGYYWWLKTFEINDKKYESYFAAGNGGQYIFIIPEEELVVVLTGGNYVGFKSRPSFKVRSQPYNILANYILPALVE